MYVTRCLAVYAAAIQRCHRDLHIKNRMDLWAVNAAGESRAFDRLSVSVSPSGIILKSQIDAQNIPLS